MKRLTLNLIIFLFCFISSTAQNNQRGKISLKVFNQQKQPAENATVELLRTKDSFLVKTALSNKT